VLASTVPLLIFAAVMTTLFERQQRASVERGLRDTARALTVAVDHELFASISVLQALAASEPLETGNLGSRSTCRRTEADCEKAGGLWMASSNKCEKK
jgi:hypothetical protein